MIELPRIGTPMYLVDAEGVNYRSRLEEVAGDTLALATPLETNEALVPRPGHQFDVYWAHTRARVILPCRLLAIADAAQSRWSFTPTGNPRLSNRREFVRGGGGGGPVRLAAEEGADVVDGRLLDISEGGLRCWVPRAPLIAPDDRLLVSLKIGKENLSLPSAILDVRQAYDEPGRHVILRFEIGERVAQLIRQHVFAWEIAERRQYALL